MILVYFECKLMYLLSYRKYTVLNNTPISLHLEGKGTDNRQKVKIFKYVQLMWTPHAEARFLHIPVLTSGEKTPHVKISDIKVKTLFRIRCVPSRSEGHETYCFPRAH